MSYNDRYLNLMPADCYKIAEIPNSVCGVSTESVISDDRHVYETLCPINPLTGHRDSMLSRLFDNDVSDSEKQLILSQLAKLKGVSSPSDLSDDDILSLIPSRYMSDPVEMERYREFVDQLRDVVSDPEPADPTPVEPAPADPAPTE